MLHSGRSDDACDVIIAMGAAVWPGGRPSPALRRRTLHAVQALHAGRGARLVVTGGLGKHPPAEAQVMRQLAHDAGVPPACILVEDRATSTLQSAIYCTRLLRQHGWSSALIVTDRYHLPRPCWCFAASASGPWVVLQPAVTIPGASGRSAITGCEKSWLSRGMRY